MSGELLRRAATFGELEALKALLEQGSNPCSIDEFGLSALHYAAWNGNVECVETLCINDIGRDKAGLQRSCIDLKSCKGFTALHLAASDGVNGVKCIDVLLNAGADLGIVDKDGNTALDAATAAERSDCISALEMERADKEDAIAAYRKEMEGTLRIQRAKLMSNNRDGSYDVKRRVPKPHSLMMHEDEIIPFSEQHFVGKHAPETIQILAMAKEQATINEARRKALVESQDTAIRRNMEARNF